MKYIAIQAGHAEIKNNCVPSLRGGTGAPQEAETNKRIALRLEQLLQQQGFKTLYVDTNFNCDSRAGTTDFDLYQQGLLVTDNP